jgi:hypothetical protein
LTFILELRKNHPEKTSVQWQQTTLLLELEGLPESLQQHDLRLIVLRKSNKRFLSRIAGWQNLLPLSIKVLL